MGKSLCYGAAMQNFRSKSQANVFSQLLLVLISNDLYEDSLHVSSKSDKYREFLKTRKRNSHSEQKVQVYVY